MTGDKADDVDCPETGLIQLPGQDEDERERLIMRCCVDLCVDMGNPELPAQRSQMSSGALGGRKRVTRAGD